MENGASPQTNNGYRILGLGDSYTIGERVSEFERFPNQLRIELYKQEIKVSTLKIIARTGWTTYELLDAIQQLKVRKEPPWDLVTLLIGVNNQFRGEDREEYRGEFVKLAKLAIEFARGIKERVIVLSIPDYGVTPFSEGSDREAIAIEIDAFNRINRDESEKLGVHYVDITPISRKAKADKKLLAPDQLHPSAKMYAEWVKLLLPIAKDILAKPKNHNTP